MIGLPWRVRNLADETLAAWHYSANRKRHRHAQGQGKLKILFCVPFYGYTGGAFAVLSAANLLSDRCAVSFLTKPSNIMNRYVSPRVRMVDRPDGPYDFCVIESGIEDVIVSQLKGQGARVILTMHGAPPAADGTRNHGYSDERITHSLAAVDSIQYVSDVQAPFFETVSGFHRRKIPNYVLPVKKSRHGRAVGLVCDTTLPHKNADAGIAAALLSSASHIEIWGKYHNRRSAGRVRWNGFSSSKARIYDSFDVLVHLSRLENQPLVILEAMSAGIPCVLAPLAAYAGFRGLEGIYFAPADDPAAVAEAIDLALDCSQAVREGLIRFWDANYSPRAVLAQWLGYLDDIRSLKEQGMREVALDALSSR